MSILSKKKTSTLWILLVQGGSYSYKVELTFTIDQQNQNKAYLMKNKILNDYGQCKIHRQIKMFILHYQVQTVHFYIVLYSY